MIKSELIVNLASKMMHLSEEQVSNCVNRILGLMSQALAAGRRIEIRGFGSFSLHFRPKRTAHNPKTGQKVITQAKYSPHFKPGKDIRDRINASRHHVKLKED